MTIFVSLSQARYHKNKNAFLHCLFLSLPNTPIRAMQAQMYYLELVPKNTFLQFDILAGNGTVNTYYFSI